MPIASNALLIVLAVYMPPQEPLPGLACALDRAELLARDASRAELADRLEHADDRQVLAAVDAPA